MKIIAVYAASANFEHGLDFVVKTIYDTFNELGIDMEEINLSHLGLPYFGGSASQAVYGIANKIKSADGVILAFSANKFAPCALMQTLLEHFDESVYGAFLRDKQVFTVCTSADGSEYDAERYTEKLVSSLNGICTVRLSIGGAYINKLAEEEIKAMIEKYAEDFYRMLRQNRAYFIPGTGSFILSAQPKIAEKIKPKKIAADEFIKNLELEKFDERQEDDIEEITNFITKQYNSVNQNKQKQVSELYKESSSVQQEAIKPHLQTCRQKTQSLPHHFQPQLAADVKAVIQINIKGEEKFEGYITIENNECSYTNGVNAEPDVTLFSDNNVWSDILNGKYSTQKAFMIGQLKVRGNFVILSKFDQMFKIEKH